MKRKTILYYAVLLGLATALHAQSSNPAGPGASLLSQFPNDVGYAKLTDLGKYSKKLHSSTCDAVVNTSTYTSVFCPDATDSSSSSDRTIAANTLTVGTSIALDGGGNFTVPTGNLITANITINVGATAVMTVTTPAAPVGNGGIAFQADCTVRASQQINCVGQFDFLLTGAGMGVTVPFNQTTTFDPTVANKIDVMGKWNGTVTTHSTTVSEAIVHLN